MVTHFLALYVVIYSIGEVYTWNIHNKHVGSRLDYATDVHFWHALILYDGM